MSRLIALLVLAVGLTAAEPITHRFIATDESRGQLLLVDQRDPSKDWTVPLPKNRDVFVSGDRVVVSRATGYQEFDLATGKALREVKVGTNIASVIRDQHGHTFLGSPEKIWELDKDDKPVRELPINAGHWLRILRSTPAGGFLFTNSETTVAEIAADGSPVRIFDLKTFDDKAKKPYGAVRLANGGTMISTGYGACLLELDAGGKLVRTIGGKDRIPGVFLNFISDFTVLPDGGVIACNWTGHGAKDSSKGPQVVQFDREGKIIWTWHDPVRAGTLHGLVILD